MIPKPTLTSTYINQVLRSNQMTQNIEVIIITLVISHNNNKDEPNDRQSSFMDKVVLSNFRYFWRRSVLDGGELLWVGK